MDRSSEITKKFTRYILLVLRPLSHEPNVTGENINNDLLIFCDWQNNGSNLHPDFERKSQEDIFHVILNKLKITRRYLSRDFEQTEHPFVFSVILKLWKSLYEKNIGFYLKIFKIALEKKFSKANKVFHWSVNCIAVYIIRSLRTFKFLVYFFLVFNL